jgi:hypothetical protein
MVIAIDFDGTCVTHEFPSMGKEIGAANVLKELVNAGHSLILFTMRSNYNGSTSLLEAIHWFKTNDIPLYGVQTNPTQTAWTLSPKAYTEMYIDDAALGCPLKFDKNYSTRPFVDWVKVRKMLQSKNII